MAAELDALVQQLGTLVAEYRASLAQVRAIDDNFRCEACERCRRCRFCTRCDGCDECTYCEGCEACVRCNRCKDSTRCRDSAQLERCDGCERSQHLILCLACVDSSHCFACVGLSGEEFCVLNQRLSRKDYFRVVAALRAQLEATPPGDDPLATPAGAPSPRFTVDSLQRIKARVRAAGPELADLADLLAPPPAPDHDPWLPEAAERVARVAGDERPPAPDYALVTWTTEPPPALTRAASPPDEP